MASNLEETRSPLTERPDPAESGDPRNRAALEIEYASLREEQLKRIESRQQLLSITLTIAGAFLGIGWGSGAVALMIYPPLAVLLAVSWAQNEIRLRQLSAYIHEHIEKVIPGLGWERYSRQRDQESRLGAPLEILAIGGIFLLTQGIAILLSWFRFSGSLVEWVLMLVDIGSVVALLALVNYVQQQSRK